MNVNDMVLVSAGLPPLTPKLYHAGRVMQETGSTVWLDVCIMGQHLPQQYKREEITAMTPELIKEHSLCETCQGYGTTDLFEDLPIGAGPDQVPHPCETCGATGKKYLRVTLHRDASGVTGQMNILPHEAEYREDGLCVHCSVPKDDHGKFVPNE